MLVLMMAAILIRGNKSAIITGLVGGERPLGICSNILISYCVPNPDARNNVGDRCDCNSGGPDRSDNGRNLNHCTASTSRDSIRGMHVGQVQPVSLTKSPFLNPKSIAYCFGKTRVRLFFNCRQ
jgi:hypothetical protein